MELSPYQRHYQKNKEKHVQRAAKRNKEQRIKLKSYLDELRSNAKCVDCGSSWPDKPWRMSFDHLPQYEKKSNIADMARKGWGQKKIEAEIAKCEIVCLLCHADRTEFRRRGAIAQSGER